MKSKSDAYMQHFASAFAARDRFLILTHRRPDGDTVGSACALAFALRKYGKTAYVFPNPEANNRLRGFLAPCEAPDGYLPETVVTVDIPSYSQMEETAKQYRDRIDFVIDHHSANQMQASVRRLIWKSAAATGELVYQLIAALGVPLDAEIAAALYISLSTDTGCFQYANTTAETHRIAAHCIEQGIDLAGINAAFFMKKSMARFRIEQMVLNSMQLFCNDRIAAIRVTLAMRAESGASEEDIEDFSAIPRQLDPVSIGITAYELADGTTKVSVRTDANADAAELCAVFGGGGHARAAGCNISAPVDAAVALLVAEASARLSA